MRRKPRRIIAGVLIAAGGLILWLAPDAPTSLGVTLLVVAAIIEIIGIYLEHKDSR